MEPARTEATDKDSATAHVRVATPYPVVRKKSFTGRKEMDDHSHDDDTRRGNLIVRWQEGLLFGEGPAKGIWYWGHSQLSIPRRFFEVDERLVVVPGLAREKLFSFGDGRAELKDAPAGVVKGDKAWDRLRLKVARANLYPGNFEI
jgi:hypothetical protein